MKNFSFLVFSFLLLSACQTTNNFPAQTAPVLMEPFVAAPDIEVSPATLRHKGRTNYSAVEAVENEEDAICVGAWCGCPTE